MNEINYQKIADKLTRRLNTELCNGYKADDHRIAVLCAMLDYLLEQQLIPSHDSQYVSTAWLMLQDIYPDYNTTSAFGSLSGDLMDFMTFDRD